MIRVRYTVAGGHVHARIFSGPVDVGPNLGTLTFSPREFRDFRTIAAGAQFIDETQGGLFLIWSIEHDAWWKAGRCGYTRDVGEAGIYSSDEAAAIVAMANYRAFNECRIPAECLGVWHTFPVLKTGGSDAPLDT